MSDIQQIYTSLLDKGLSEEEINKEILKKKSEFHGFITKEGALFLIAKEIGVNIQSPDIDSEIYSKVKDSIDFNEFTIPITDVKEEMYNIVLLGRIKTIFNSKNFIRKDGSSGVVNSFLIIDTSAIIKIVLWGDYSKLINSEFFREGNFIRIIGGYSKKDMNNNIEVHVGKKGKIILCPNDIDKKTKKELEKIDLYKSNLDNYHKIVPNKITHILKKEGYLKLIIGKITNIELKEFNKKNKEKSFLLRFTLIDETGSIDVLVWDLQAIEVLKIIEDNVNIRLMNIIVRSNKTTKKKEIYYLKESTIIII